MSDQQPEGAANEDQQTRNLRDLMDETRNALRSLGQELRNTAQVAQKDAEEGWKEIKPKLDELEERLRDGIASVAQEVDRSELRTQLQLAMMEARDRWRQVEPRITPFVDRIVAATEQAMEGAVDSLAGAQNGSSDLNEQWRRVKERAEAQRQRLTQELGEAGKALEDAAEGALKEMKGAFARLRDQLSSKKKH